MSEDARRVVGSLAAVGDVSVERSLVGALRAEDVRFERSIAGPVMARGDVTVEQGGCGPVLAGGNVSFHQAGCGPVMTRGDVSFTQAGTQSVLAGSASIGRGAFVGVVISPKVTMADGARVLMNTKQAAALGAAVGAVVGLFLLRRSM
jgi:hypothetical protein